MVTLLATGFLIYISSGFTALFFFAFLLSSRLAFWLGPPATSLTSINQVADAATHAYIQYSTTIFWTLILLLSAWGWIGVISIKKIMKKKLYRPFADFKIWLLASFFVLSIPCIIIYLSHIDPFE